jgi:hypothetical protein
VQPLRNKTFLPRNTRNLLREKVTDLPLDARLRKLDVARRGIAVQFHKQLPCPSSCSHEIFVLGTIGATPLRYPHVRGGAPGSGLLDPTLPDLGVAVSGG